MLHTSKWPLLYAIKNHWGGGGGATKDNSLKRYNISRKRHNISRKRDNIARRVPREPPQGIDIYVTIPFKRGQN